MSRIGKQPNEIPEGITIEVSSSNVVTAKGKLGELSLQVTEPITVRVEESVVTLERPNDEKESRSKHGLYRALIFNMIEGVSKGYTKGYKFLYFAVCSTCSSCLIALWSPQSCLLEVQELRRSGPSAQPDDTAGL